MRAVRHPAHAARRTRGLAAAVLAFAIVLVLLVTVSPGSRGTSAVLSAGPDTIGIIDGSQDVLRAVVTGTGGRRIAHGAGAWITESAITCCSGLTRLGRSWTVFR